MDSCAANGYKAAAPMVGIVKAKRSLPVFPYANPSQMASHPYVEGNSSALAEVIKSA
jgi:hypothetical protein